MEKILYIMEGEIEERFIRFLQINKYIPPGKCAVFNLMQRKLKDTDNILTNLYDRLFCIIDTDRLSVDELTNLTSNIRKLKEITTKPIYLSPQTLNFEDELRYISGNNDLHNLIGCKYSGTTEVKRVLAQKVDYNKIIENLDVERYCCKTEIFNKALLQQGFTMPSNVIISSIVLKGKNRHK